MNIVESLQLKDDHPAVLQVKNTEKTQLIAIGLKKGQILKKHTTAMPATLIVLSGLLSFEMEGRSTQLQAFCTFDIPGNVPHEVKGLEESIFIVSKEK